MMGEMAIAETSFDPIARAHKMNSVVHGLIPDESTHHSKEQESRRTEAGKRNQHKGHGEWRQPGTSRKHSMRVAMVYVMERAHEGVKTMAQRTMDCIFQQRPGAQSAQEQNRAAQHALTVSRSRRASKCSHPTAQGCIERIAG